MIALFLAIVYLCDYCDYQNNAIDLHTNAITVLGILLGFSISSFTILLTVETDNIKKAKDEVLMEKLFGRKISLYDGVLVGMAHIVIIQCILLVFNLIYPMFISLKSCIGLNLFAVNISIMSYVILSMMREILNFYFIITKNDEQNNKKTINP
ncbi:MAG: hypothetical protein R3Y59_07915 [bacterium]